MLTMLVLALVWIALLAASCLVAKAHDVLPERTMERFSSPVLGVIAFALVFIISAVFVVIVGLSEGAVKGALHDEIVPQVTPYVPERAPAALDLYDNRFAREPLGAP